MNEFIYGNFRYCYNSVPTIRGYCSYKTLIKYSKPHPAYQRATNQTHVKEIKEFINGTGYKFMPEIILSFDCRGMYENEQEWKTWGYLSPIEYLLDNNAIGILKVRDFRKGVEFQRLKADKINTTIRLNIQNDNPILDTHTIFNRIDGNHRLEALKESGVEDFEIPYCIILLSSQGDSELHDLEKMEMEIFHNINSKVQPLSEMEQYSGLFGLFNVSELEQYGKEFSITKAYLEQYKELKFTNIKIFMDYPEETVLNCTKFLLNHGLDVTPNDLATVFSKLEHTYFYENPAIRKCKNNKSFIPYVFYCFENGMQVNAKLTAYNKWFIKNKLYDIKDFDPASMIDVFNKIYEIRKKQIFVAMPFKNELDFVFDAITETVKKINQETGIDLLMPIRIDKQITGFSYDIVNEILKNIENAGLLIADLTLQNANVYYEIGYAQGLLKAKLGNTAEVLYLISNPDDPEHPYDEAKFDLQHYKMIGYKNDGNGTTELKEKLEMELKAFYGV